MKIGKAIIDDSDADGSVISKSKGSVSNTNEGRSIKKRMLENGSCWVDDNLADVNGKGLGVEINEHRTMKKRMVETGAIDAKGKSCVTNLNENRSRKKRKLREGTKGGEERIENMDRISELPEHINHHILSLLRCPKDVARTSILSKKWRNLWASFPAFDFDQKLFRTPAACKVQNRFQERDVQRKDFKNYIEKSLSTRLEPMVCIQKFRLYLTYFNSALNPHLTRWINAAIAKNVKELEIHVEVRKLHYSLPPSVLVARQITSLKLYGCKLDTSTTMDLSNLRELSIKKARINENMIQSFISSCPLIEDLRLVFCKGLVSLHISSLFQLKRIEVHDCYGLRSVELKAQTLQTFWFRGKGSLKCSISLAGCDNLKSLTMKGSNMTDEWLQRQISESPVLESLVLMDNDALQRITILSRKLKKLALVRCSKLMEAIVDAPNLVSFEYTGSKMPSLVMNTSRLQEARLYFESSSSKQRLIHEVQKFFEKIPDSKDFKLVSRYKQNVTVHEELSGIQLLPRYDYKLELIRSSEMVRGLVDTWLSACHPKNLTVVSSMSSSNNEFLKFVANMLTKRDQNPQCCRYYIKKCWRHYLDDVKMSEKSETSSIMTTYKLKWRLRGPDVRSI